LVTGATGLVGKALVRRLVAEARHEVLAAVRREVTSMGDSVEIVEVGDYSASTDWIRALSGVDVVVALAARAHIVGDTSPERLGEYRSVNVDGTLNLAEQAAHNEVRRFVFLSSIKVNGEGGSLAGSDAMPRPQPYKETDPPAPEDAYSISKYEAELGLREISAETGMEVVIIRPPLVYGPGVRANFQTLMRVVARGIPLPLGAIHNRRSLVALDNLVDFILTCIEHPAAANETFLVSDGEDLSTTELIRRLTGAMGRPARLIPIPAFVLLAGAILVGKRDVAQRLLGSLQADISKARGLLGWTPPLSVDEGLRRTVASQ
jgi:nucleoside-diphosphate-sugar epimerase